MPERSEYTIRYTMNKVCQSVIYRLQILTISNTAILHPIELQNLSIATIVCLDCEDRIYQYSNAPGIVNTCHLDRFNNSLGMLLEYFNPKAIAQILSMQKQSIASFLNATLQLAIPIGNSIQKSRHKQRYLSQK